MVAGGTGNRFGAYKQFLDLNGMSVVDRSVKAARSVAGGVVLVVPDSTADGDDPAASGAGADLVVTGGATRSQSVRAGLAAVPGDAGVIIVHDAARPLASPALFASVLGALADPGVAGVIPVMPVTDTLKRVEAGKVHSTVDRTGVVSVQTPQAFVASVLRAAHTDGGEATDDAGLLEARGATVRTVPGDPSNVKLTYPGDLAVARALLRDATAGDR